MRLFSQLSGSKAKWNLTQKDRNHIAQVLERLATEWGENGDCKFKFQFVSQTMIDAISAKLLLTK